MTLFNQTAPHIAQFINQDLNKIFCDVLDDDELVISSITTAPDVEGWDSLANIRIMVTIEKVFDIRFTSAEISKLTDVGELAELILSKKVNG